MIEFSAHADRSEAPLQPGSQEGPTATPIRAAYLREPVLAFAGDREHVDPKTGIARYGPASLGSPNHPATVRLGYVGTGLSIASAQELLERDQYAFFHRKPTISFSLTKTIC